MSWKISKKGFGLAAILAGFLAATLPTLGSASIWFDEAFSRHIIRFDFGRIWHFTSLDVHPPFYYFCLKVWSMIFGASDFSIRALSVAFGLATLIALYFLIKRLYNSKAALLSVFFVAFSPLFIKYSQEARMYTLVALLAIVSIRAYYEAFVAANSQKKQTTWRRLYILFIALGMWTQYLSALTVLALWAFRLYQVIKKQPKSKRKFKLVTKSYFSDKWLVTHLWAALWFLPWIPFFLTQAIQVKSGFWIPPTSFVTIPNFITQTLLFKDAGSIDGWTASLVSIVVFFVIWAIIYIFRHKKDKTDRLKLLLFAYVGPVVILFLFSLPPFSSIFVNRYLLTSAILLSTTFGIILNIIYKSDKKLAISMAILMIAMQIMGTSNVYQTGGGNNITRQVIEQTKPKMKAGEPIITEANSANGWIFYEAAQYTTSDNPIYFVDSSADYHLGSMKMLEEDDTFKIKDLEEFSKQHKTVWLLSRPGNKIQEPLLSSWQLVEEIIYDSPTSGEPLYSMQKYQTEN